MNRYQYEVFKNIGFSSYNNKNESLALIESNTESLILTQNENYSITEYNVNINYNGISSLELLYGAQWKKSDSNTSIKVSFLNKCSKLRISFRDNIVDPIELDVKFIDADIDAYNAKIYKQNIQEITKKINFQLLPTTDYLNIIFKPVSSEYEYSVIELYYTISNDNNDNQLMARIRVDKDYYYKTIEKLTEGSYAVRLIQYDNDNVAIFTSDYTKFSVRNYSTSHHSYILEKK